jgi:hypothetical protein
VVIVNAPSAPAAALPWMFPLDPARATPLRVRTLAGAIGRVDVLREDARTLLVEFAPDAMPDPMISAFRDDGHSLREGETISVTGMRAEVVRIDAQGAPVAVRYRFERDLEDPSFRWIGWRKRMTDIRPPAIGERTAFGG